ncbi:M23 family metallopeptidase [Streptomyces sp. 8N706]|uniref:M23 family metallopeptidase n=1 Tax=Streptomyces sp. 8N706 TaxID=3457416 RepID=UPI003FD40CB5
MSTVDLRRAHQPHPRPHLVRHLICGGLLGALFIVPAAGGARALEGDPPPAHQHGPERDASMTDNRGPALETETLDDDPWEEELDQDPEEGYGEDYGDDETGSPWQEDAADEVSGAWSRPVTSDSVSAAYGIPGDWIAGHHTGIDFAVSEGTSVKAIGSGVVTRAGWGGDYGEMVMVKLDDGHYTLFAHLSEVVVKEGARVRAGTLLGYSGNTGNSTGPHLHFEVRTSSAYGSDIEPVAYLEARGILL